MDLSVYVRFIVALAFVLSLIGLIYWCLRRFGLNRLIGDNSTGNRLEIIETKKNGIKLLPTETLLFHLYKRADTPEFKAFAKILKEIDQLK